MPTVPEIITESVLKQLEQGVAPWRKPWATSIPRNLISKKPYRGLNVFLLATQGYGSPCWLTFNQAKQLGAHVRQGEKSTLVSFWKSSEYAKENHDTGETESKTSVLLRYYRVFNVEQCEGLKALHGDEHKPVQPLAECESIANGMPNPPRIEQHSQAFYRPSADMVGMPARNCFESAEGYYSTLFHELTHSTGHKSRLNRFEENSTDHQFGSESYSKEELIAEMGAAMLAGMAGISQSTLSNSASYLQSWIKRLKSDSRLIISAASHAQKAADYILGKTQAEASDCPSALADLGTRLQVAYGDKKLSEELMIAFADKDGRLTVTGTAGEWSQFRDRLDRPSLKQMSDTETMHEILIVASAVPLNGAEQRRECVEAHLKRVHTGCT